MQSSALAHDPRWFPQFGRSAWNVGRVVPHPQAAKSARRDAGRDCSCSGGAARTCGCQGSSDSCGCGGKATGCSCGAMPGPNRPPGRSTRAQRKLGSAGLDSPPRVANPRIDQTLRRASCRTFRNPHPFSTLGIAKARRGYRRGRFMPGVCPRERTESTEGRVPHSESGFKHETRISKAAKLAESR